MDDSYYKDQEREDRLGFIRKVYAILSVQLIITAGCITLTKLTPEMNEGIKKFGVLAIVLLVVAIIIEIMLICCRNVSRKVPMNYILLLIFTLCETFLFSFICAFYPAVICLYAAGSTAALTFALTLYACCTKTDFTVCGGLMISISIALLTLMVMSMFMSWVSWWHPVVSAILVVFYGVFLVHDTQLVAGGG